ncbi:hypothetical protein Gasu2_46630 [Galdieria sulphuraria]|nr:hypothetical protein Gasu2_46630 [Galdieria sulphuraria]
MSKEKLHIARFEKHTTAQILHLLKEPSMGLYYTTEHLRKRGIPQLVYLQNKLDAVASQEDDLKIDCHWIRVYESWRVYLSSLSN